MEYDIVKDLTDKQIEEYFENGSVFVDVEAGLDLIKRGFKDKLGVDIVDWGEGETPTTETYNDVGDSMQKQKGAKKLVILNDNSLLVTALCLGFDPEETLNLYLEKEPTNVELFMPDGSLEKVEFTKTADNVYSINAKVEPMYPVVLKIK